MGLAGRKVKQRIDNDPRNLSWADDASRFGQAYLSKLGWDSSKGLGASGDGMKSHITVTQRLNLLGIGAGAKQGAEDIAWKQNRDYELVLARLNRTSQRTVDGDETTTVVEMEVTGVVAEGGFVKADSGDAIEQEKEGEGDAKEEKREKKKRKKDRREDEEKEKSEKKKSKKRRKEEDNANEEQPKPPEEQDETPAETPTPIRTPIARPMAHRARFLKSKRMALENPAAMAEILGVASSSASPISSYPSTPAFGLSTSSTPGLTESPFSSLTTSAILSGVSTPTPTPDSMETLTTSTKSMADYFKERLAAKASKSSPLSREEPASTPVDDSDDAPRRGLGSRGMGEGSGLGTPSSGLGFGSGMKFSSLMGFGPPKALEASLPVVEEIRLDAVPSSEKGKEKEEKKAKKKKEKSEKEKRCKDTEETKANDEESTPSAEVVDQNQDGENSEVREKKKKKKKKSRTDDE